MDNDKVNKYRRMAIDAISGHFNDPEPIYTLGTALEKALDDNERLEGCDDTAAALQETVDDLEAKLRKVREAVA